MKFELNSYGLNNKWYEITIQTDNCKITEQVEFNDLLKQSAELFVDCIYADNNPFNGSPSGNILQKLIDLNYIDFDDIENFVEYTKAN